MMCVSLLSILYSFSLGIVAFAGILESDWLSVEDFESDWSGARGPRRLLVGLFELKVFGSACTFDQSSKKL